MGRKVPDGCPLTARQFRVLQLLGDGLTGEQIAAELGVSASAVRSASSAAFKALQCANTVQAVVVMGRRGWIGWQPPADSTPLAVEHPFLAAYVREFEASRWPHAPSGRTVLGMRLALAGHRNHQAQQQEEA
jgi:DNA-binding CsgD family transcriptional regulator